MALNTHVPALRRGRPQSAARRGLPVLAALAGTATVVAGLLLPWLTVFGGTTPLDGIAAGGGTLAGIGTGAGLSVLVAHRYGWAAGRWLALGGATVVLVGALWSARAVAEYAASPGPAAALASPASGPGPWVLAAGAALVAAASLAPVPHRTGSPGLGARLGLASTALAAGWVHLLLAPEHWAESVLLGAGFLGAGLLQLALAIAIVARPARPVHFALMVLNVALVAVWLYAVFVGLPLGEAHDHTAAGWAVGAGEPITPAAALAKAAEIAGAVWAGAMACRAAPADGAVRRPSDRLGVAAP